jgi:hypothetical protein
VRSTRQQAGVATSNIVWRYGNVTVPRHLRDVVVTEYGIADLRGKSDSACVTSLLAVADSRFQQRLQDDAQTAGKLAKSFKLPDEATRNTPERLSDMLGAPRRAGLLPPYPLGTDMTETEERLAGALSRLKSAGYVELARSAFAGLGGDVSAPHGDALQRMALDAPQSLSDRAMRALVLGALRAQSPPS